MSWFEAYDATVRPLLAARGVLDVVHAAETSGLMAALRDGGTPAALVAACRLDPDRAAELLTVLELSGVVERDGETLCLNAAWSVLTGDRAFAALSDTLAASDVEQATIRSVGGVGSYWEIDAAQRVAFARAVSPSPFQPGMVEMVRRISETDPDLQVARDGGLHLELGCGVAGRILVSLQALPAMRAVGVELSPDLADEARRRAEQVGVADRFEVVVCDAADLDRPGEFDSGFWSQFFFPAHAREGALRAAFRSLRPGAVLMAPILGNPSQLAADPQGDEARARAAFRVVLGSWGVPDRTPDELVAEIGAAGFVDVEARVTPWGLWGVRAVRP